MVKAGSTCVKTQVKTKLNFLDWLIQCFLTRDVTQKPVLGLSVEE